MPTPWNTAADYDRQTFLAEARELLAGLPGVTDREAARELLFHRIDAIAYRVVGQDPAFSLFRRSLSRDAARTLQTLVLARSAELAGFDLVGVLQDLVADVPRPELQPGFWAELIHLLRALHGRPDLDLSEEEDTFDALSGREAAQERSRQLDVLWTQIEERLAHFPDGLSDEARQRRRAWREAVWTALGGDRARWDDWHWQRDHVITSAEALTRTVRLDPAQVELVARARRGRLPFGITPYYASLLDDDWETGRDRALRAQVLPPAEYVDALLNAQGTRAHSLDFMKEADTSPVDLITRRYPAIVILKPYNTCPQICVYCQRNWEIEEALASDALATPEQLDQAIAWLAAHPSIKEVLVTGGDPLTLEDDQLEEVLGRVAALPHIDMIRIGTRTPVTMPMRITAPLADLLASFREPGRREVVVVTHFEQVYEVTIDTVRAIERLRSRGIAVYNQHVLQFHVSRRFETVALRLLLRRIGVDPYYTFVPKGKSELLGYRVPIARVLQERNEEARLLPGIRRTDETVFNVPRLGKNHVRAMQNRDLLAVLPDGSRVYDFHPWEKHVLEREAFTSVDPPILDYLSRLQAIGEDPAAYHSIWYYY